jgi:hypothetical protein
MAEPTFLVVPFLASGFSPHPVSPIALRIEAYARAVAGKAAAIYAGVAVLEQPAGEFDEPRLVDAIGRVPGDLPRLLGVRIRHRWRSPADLLLARKGREPVLLL